MSPLRLFTALSPLWFLAACWPALGASPLGAPALPATGSTPSPCTAPPAADLSDTLTLRTLRGPGITQAQVDQVVSEARGWWGPWGLELNAMGPAIAIPQTSLLPASREQLAEHLAEAPEGSAPTRAAAELLFAELRGLIDAHARPARPEVVVMLLPTLAPDGSAAADWFSDLAGLSFSPALQSRLGGEQPGLLDALNLDPGYTPVVFLSMQALEGRPDDQLRLTPAHELGHALGLPHVADAANLMDRGLPDCWPGITPEQLAMLVIPAAPEDAATILAPPPTPAPHAAASARLPAGDAPDPALSSDGRLPARSAAGGDRDSAR